MSSYWNNEMKKSVEKRATQSSSTGIKRERSSDDNIRVTNYWEKLLGPGTTLNIDGVNQWLADVSGTTDEFETYRLAQGNRFTKDYGGHTYAKIKELLAAGSDVQSFLDAHKGELEDYEGAQATLDSARRLLREYDADIYRKNSYYSQWDTEDAYNRAMQESSWAKKYQGKGYQELVPLLGSLEDGEEKQWLTDYAGYIDYDERVNMDLDAASREIQTLQDHLDRARNLEVNYNEYRNSPLLMLTQGDTWRDLETRYDAFVEKYGSIEQLQEDIEKKRRRMAEGKQTQDSIRQTEEYEQWKQNVRAPELVQKELDRVNQAIVLNEQAIRRSNQGSTQQDLQRRREAEAGRQALEQQRSALEQELQYGRMRNYMSLMERPDFEINSQYVPSGNGVVTMAKGSEPGAVLDPASGLYVNTGFQDIAYDYINKNEKAKAYANTAPELRTVGLDRGWLLHLTEEETGIYNYLYHTEGKAAASEFLDVMRGELNQRQRQSEEMKWAEYARAHPVWASAASIGMAPLKAVSAAGQLIDRIGDGRIDQNASYNRASYISSAIRNQVTQEIQKNEKWGQLGAFGYQTAMSMGDFLMNGLAGGGLFGVPGVTMAIMGSGAAADTVISAKDRGVGDAQAFGLGIVAGLAEALTERFSLEALLDADLLKNGIGVYMLKNSLTEGSEEVASSIINLWAEIEASKEKSEWRQAIREYQDMGYAEGEAFAKAVADQAASMGMDFLGGVISGGVMSGAASAQYKASTTRTGKTLGRRGLTDPGQVQQILNAGADAGKGTAANAVAGRLQKKLDAGRRLTAYDKGQLYQSNPQAVSEAVFNQGSVQLAGPMVQGIDNKHEDWKQAQRLASITGRDIRFYNGDPEQDGFYDRKTGEIFINVDRASEHQAAYVFSHELTHSTELGDSYTDLKNYIRGKLISEGRDWNLIKRQKAEAYANAGHALENDADIEAEVVAQYVQDNLLSNEQELFELFWAEPTIGQKILNWFDRILAKFKKGENARERLFIEEARQKVLSAWESSNRVRNQEDQTEVRGQPERTEQGGYSAEDLEELDRMYREQYDRGELTEEQYDEYLDWRDHEAAVEEGEAELGRQYSFAGPKARTADLGKLEQAKAMQSNGVANETIRQQTGWFKGMDGKWRFEIDDSRMRYYKAGDALFSEMHPEYARHQELMQKWLYGELEGKEETEFRDLDEVWGREHQRLSDRVRRGNATLQNMLNHDKLFEAYPELRGAKVTFEDMEDGKRGQYDPNTNTITLSNTLRNAPQETLLHEVQHTIQSVENFTGGASVEYWKEKRRDIVETIAAARKNLDLWLADIGYPEVSRQSLLAVSRREKPLAQHRKDMEEFKANSDYARQIAACEAELADFQRQYDEITHGMTAYEQYENTAGEIEARDTANPWKAGLDEERRKNTPPDLGDERTVFAEGTDRIYQERRLTEEDLEDYMRAGNRGNKNKLSALKSGQNIILTSAQQIKEFIRNAIDRTLRSNTTVAYGKVNDRLASDVQRVSNGEIEIKDNYLELIPDNLQHAYEQHHIAKQPGDINLTRADFENIPEYLDSYTEIVYAIRYASGKIGVCVSKKLPSGRILLIETVSKSRGSLQFKNAIGVSESKYQTDYIAVYKKKAGTNTRGSDSSNNSLHDGSSSNTSISNPEKKVNQQFSINVGTVNKRDVARDLRAILSRGGDPRELQRYVDGLEQSGQKTDQTRANRYQDGENRNSTAQEILQVAHSNGQSVEEYLRWNPEQFERDGKWRPEALEAMRMEQGRRQYSLNEGTEQREHTESLARGISRDQLPTKAQNYLRRAESKLLNRIGEALSVPRYVRYKNLQGIIQEISNVYLQEGTISDDKMDELFDKAYASGIVTDAEFYNQYKEIKKHLSTYGVTISDRDKSDIPDFNDFRKRAFGTLRIVNEGGVPVDTAYQELQTMAPELFPDNITHPADQLMRMFDVGQSIAVSQKNLDEYYGHSEAEREEFRRWARNDFDVAVGDAFRDLKLVKRYAEEHSEEVEAKKILTVEDAEKAYEDLKQLRRNVDKVRAKNLLSESDELLLGRMLKGEIGPQHLNPKENNVKGITALYEAKLAYESQCEVLAAYKRSVRAKHLQEADKYLETARTWKDKKAGILYARETMRRNIMDIVPDRKVAEQIAEVYFESVHIAEAKSTRFKNDYRDRVRALNLSTKVMKGNLVSEAHAVQLLGEAMDNIRVMENSRGRMGMRDGKTLTEWRAVVDDLWINNAGLDRKKIENAVQDFRKIYDELFQQMNRVRVENGYEPVNYRQGYFPHFQPGGDGIMAFFGKAMGINTQVDSLPTTISGLTHTFKPGIQWFGNAQERLGFNTAYDAVEGFDKYIEGVASVIFQTENIQRLRALATQVRYRTTDEGIRKQVDYIRMDDRLTEEEKQTQINAIYEHGKFSLSNFVAELDEYTNLLANKKSKYDRTMESLIDRRAYMLMKNWENRVGANMIAGNISSAMTNFIPLTQAGAQLDSGMILKGMFDTLRNMKQGDSLVIASDFLTNRRGSDPLAKTWAQKASGILGTPMELIDNFTSESIVRAAYMQNLKRGLSEAEAMHQADIFAAGVMADRSKGAMPTLFESRNPLFKAFTQFQLEVNNQFSEVFKDLPRNHREKGLAVLAMVLLKYFLGAWLYNELFEKLIGRRPALDPIDMLNQTVGDLTGYEIPNLFDMASDLVHGEDVSFETEKVGIGEAGSNLAASVLNELPFSVGLNLIGVETDGGRLPAASAIPDFSAIWQAATDGELTRDQRWKKLQDELNKLAYVLPPFGGGQVSKSYKGIKAYLEGGSYSMDRDGNEILQYPVYKDDPDDAFWSLVRAAFMGKNSLPEAHDWVENGYDSLDQYETVVYKDLLECGVKDRDAYALVDQLRKLDETETEAGARRAEGRRILAKSDISAEGKAAAFYGMVATKTEREWMDELVDAGVEQAGTMAFVSNLYDTEKLRGAEKKQEQLSAFLDAPLSEEEKMVAVGFIMDTDLETESGNPTQYAKFLTALSTGLTVDKYMEIRATETDIEDYLELADIGIKGEKAADLAITINGLEPADDYGSVTWIQRSRTIIDSGLSEQEQMAALQTVMYESTYEKMKIGHDFGMNVKSYIDLKSIMPEFDANTNGSYSQQETEDAINALAGDDNVLYALTGTTPNGYILSDREKAILWQLQNKSWKPNRNPFDREVGQMVYDILTAEDPDDAVATAESGEGFDVASLLALMK